MVEDFQRKGSLLIHPVWPSVYAIALGLVMLPIGLVVNNTVIFPTGLIAIGVGIAVLVISGLAKLIGKAGQLLTKG